MATCTGCKKHLGPKDNRITYASDPKRRPFCPDCAVHPFRRWVGQTFFTKPLLFTPTCCGSWDCSCAPPPAKPKKRTK